jgi:monoamine oxidase
MSGSGKISPGKTGSGKPPVLSRRGLLRGATVTAGAAGLAAAGGSALAPASAAATVPARRGKSVDVVIVGAGLAGLAAARDLAARGRSVVVLEGNKRVGGRSWTEPAPGGAWVDMGGQWVGPTQDHVLGLLKSLGLKTFPFFTRGNLQILFGDQKYVFSPSAGLPFPPNVVKDLQAAFHKIDALAQTVPPAAPWSAPGAAGLDSMSAATWISRNMTVPMAIFLVKEAIWGWFAVEPRDVSMLHVLFYVSAAGGVGPLEKHGVAMRVKGGTQQISELMAQELGNGRVLLETPVQTIDQTGADVVVSTPNGTFSGRRVIVAMAPTMASRIAYNPALPANHDQLTQRQPMGSTIKCHAVYPTPFWRKAGLNGQVFSDTTPVAVSADNSPPSGRPGILCAFLEAQPSRDWTQMPDAQIQAMVVSALTSYFGPQASDPSRFYIANWPSEPWSRGCFAGTMPTGAWVSYQGVYKVPVGRIHWAGTETATKWYGYMDGALSSGERAATEIMRLL